MRLVGSREATIVTDLSADRLREWTGRRGLVSPDIPAHGKGTQARFSWQTLLVLRLAATLRDRLHVELSAYKSTLRLLQVRLAGEPFHGLTGCFVMLDVEQAMLLRSPDASYVATPEGFCVLSLQPHLDAIASAIGVTEKSVQRSLFAAMAVR